MVSKIIEIRDSGTFIPALAIRLGSPNERERYLLSRSGFGHTFEDQIEYIVLCKIERGWTPEQVVTVPLRKPTDKHLIRRRYHVHN